VVSTGRGLGKQGKLEPTAKPHNGERLAGRQMKGILAPGGGYVRRGKEENGKKNTRMLPGTHREKASAKGPFC